MNLNASTDEINEKVEIIDKNISILVQQKEQWEATFNELNQARNVLIGLLVLRAIESEKENAKSEVIKITG